MSCRTVIHSAHHAHAPVLKWAGGKSQLLNVIDSHLPTALKNGTIDTYIEPFVGGGAVFFYIMEHYPVKNAVLLDINPELIILYKSIRDRVETVIRALERMEKTYHGLPNEEARRRFFYDVREQYNCHIPKGDDVSVNPERAAMTIYLNRTCFNGLFRVNSRGAFNVPFGRYKKPRILYVDSLRAASRALACARIKQADFAQTTRYILGQTFIYYDPPYRPLSDTANFTSYAREKFGDDEQVRLANLYRVLNEQNICQLLSNSDSINGADGSFFDTLYAGFPITRIEARRAINSNPTKRGRMQEILVYNYEADSPTTP